MKQTKTKELAVIHGDDIWSETPTKNKILGLPKYISSETGTNRSQADVSDVNLAALGIPFMSRSFVLYCGGGGRPGQICRQTANMLR